MKENNNNPNKDINIPFLINNDKNNNDILNINQEQNKSYEVFGNININDINEKRKTIAPKYISPRNTKQNSEPIIGDFNSRKTYNKMNLQQRESNFRKRITQFLLKKKNKKPQDVFDMSSDEDDDDEESNEENDYENNLDFRYEKNSNFKNLVKLLMEKKRTNEWNEYLDSYKKKVRESQTLWYKLKTIFHIDSDFIVIWKTSLRIFHIFILFIFFFKYVFYNLTKNETSSNIQKRILLIYYMINIMFFIDLIFSVLILIFNGGSILTYFKLPLKIYTVYPFELKKENFYLILPKFLRVDIFQKIFSSWESFINLRIELYVHNYPLKIFMTCITQMVKYLLIFGLYAHLNCCILSYFDELDYASSLFYTIEAFTVVGFGEQSPKQIQSIILVILNLLIGVNLFSLMSSNIKNLSDKIYSFYRDTSFNENFDFMIFQMQKSIGKILPSKTRQKMISFLLFRRGLSFNDIKEEYKNILDLCKNGLYEEISKKLLEFLKLEYKSYFFKDKNEDFMINIFQNLKPKIFKPNKVLIKYGEKVNKLYFLLSGQIYATDYNNRPIYTLIDNSIFGEYEFITDTLSYFNIKVDPNRPAYGFVLDKNNWETISKRHVLSANYFIKQIIKKRKKHMQWVKNNKSKLFDAPPVKQRKQENLEEEKELSKVFELNSLDNIDTSNNINSWKDKNENLDRGSMINIADIEKEKNKKILEIKEKKEKEDLKNLFNLKITNEDKDPKYNYSNINIIKNIDDLHKEINRIEFNFIDDKEFILKNLRNNNL